MLGKTRLVSTRLDLSIEYFLHFIVPKQWRKLDVDLKSAAIGFASALVLCSFLLSVSAGYTSCNYWIGWLVIIGIGFRFMMDQTTAQHPIPFVKPQRNHRLNALHQANQRLWQILQKQAIAKQHLQASNQKLLHLATTDGLTQVKNRYFFNQEIQHEWKRSQRDGQPLSLILFDVDHFKKYNDYYGHQAGDVCLQEIAKVAQQSINRPADFVARYGGEEFAIVLPQTTEEGAIAIAQRIQDTLHDLTIPHQQSDVSNIVSISLGITSIIPTDDDSCETFIAQADQALYHAKHYGRDRYVIAQ